MEMPRHRELLVLRHPPDPCDRQSMKRWFFILPFVALASCASTDSAIAKRYVCSCDPGCECTSVSDQPGKCECGEDLVLETE